MHTTYLKTPKKEALRFATSGRCYQTHIAMV